MKHSAPLSRNGPAHRARAAMARHTPSQPVDLSAPFYLALKAGLSTGVAIALARLLANPDLVTATFVAVLCCSPTFAIGLRRGFAQLVGSVVGGAFGTVALAAGLDPLLGIPLAVSGAVYASHLAQLPGGYAVAAFTALFVQLVPFGDPVATYGVRLEAVLIGAAAGTALNIAISALAYRRVFTRRLERFERLVDTLLEEAQREGLSVVARGFPVYAQLAEETCQARTELRWRRAKTQLGELEAIAAKMDALGRILHLVYDMSLLLEPSEGDEPELRAFLEWVRLPQGDPPALSSGLSHVALRLVDEVRIVRPAAPCSRGR